MVTALRTNGSTRLSNQANIEPLEISRAPPETQTAAPLLIGQGAAESPKALVAGMDSADDAFVAPDCHSVQSNFVSLRFRHCEGDSDEAIQCSLTVIASGPG